MNESLGIFLIIDLCFIWLLVKGLQAERNFWRRDSQHYFKKYLEKL